MSTTFSLGCNFPTKKGESRHFLFCFHCDLNSKALIFWFKAIGCEFKCPKRKADIKGQLRWHVRPKVGHHPLIYVCFVVSLPCYLQLGRIFFILISRRHGWVNQQRCLIMIIIKKEMKKKLRQNATQLLYLSINDANFRGLFYNL